MRDCHVENLRERGVQATSCEKMLKAVLRSPKVRTRDGMAPALNWGAHIYFGMVALRADARCAAVKKIVVEIGF